MMQANDTLLSNLMHRMATDCIELDPFDLLKMPQAAHQLTHSFTKGQYRNDAWITQKYMLAKYQDQGVFLYLDTLSAASCANGCAALYLGVFDDFFRPCDQGVCDIWQTYFEPRSAGFPSNALLPC